MRRPADKHIDNRELNALVTSCSETGQDWGLSPVEVQEAERHVGLCKDCSSRVLRYRRLINLSSEVAISTQANPGTDCPKDVAWHEVAAGLWPLVKVKQLIKHAALCDYCGRLLRSATTLGEPSLAEEKLLAQLKLSSGTAGEASSAGQKLRRQSASTPVFAQLPLWAPMKRTVSAVALLLTFGAVLTIGWTSLRSFSDARFAEFAAGIHEQYTQGDLALDIHLESQQALNEWFKTRLQFPLALPASPPVPGEERPYRLEGAGLVQVAGKSAAYIAYRMQEGPASLMVAPDSVAVASGGIEVGFKKVTFHYATVRGHKVVTWSQHGLTYALVSQEGNSSQRSCMVCHSAMRDRDLSHTPTPLLHSEKNFAGLAITQ